MVGHRMKAIYRRDAIGVTADLPAAADKLAAIERRAETGTGTVTGAITTLGGR